MEQPSVVVLVRLCTLRILEVGENHSGVDGVVQNHVELVRNRLALLSHVDLSQIGVRGSIVVVERVDLAHHSLESATVPHGAGNVLPVGVRYSYGAHKRVPSRNGGRHVCPVLSEQRRANAHVYLLQPRRGNGIVRQVRMNQQAARVVASSKLYAERSACRIKPSCTESHLIGLAGCPSTSWVDPKAEQPGTPEGFQHDECAGIAVNHSK